MSVAVDHSTLSALTRGTAPDLRLAHRIAVRHSKPLDVRQHKKDWLKIEFLRKLQRDTRQFCEHVLSHPQQVAVDACYVCGSREHCPFGETYGVPYRQCATCSHVYAAVRLTPEDLTDYYRKTYFEGTADVDPGLVDARAHRVLEPKLQFVTAFVQTTRRRWLDVGAGNGGVVACARDLNFDAFGLEPGSEARAFARKVFGFEMHDHTIEQELARSGPGSYDLVSFFMVLEHVTNPAAQVRAATELLAPGGLLVIEVPTADSVSAMADIAFPQQGLRQTVGVHIMNYTQGSLRHLLDSNDLETEGMWFMGQDIFNLVVHMALSTPSFLESRLCSFLLDNNDALQKVVDEKEQSDEVVLVARKPLHP